MNRSSLVLPFFFGAGYSILAQTVAGYSIRAHRLAQSLWCVCCVVESV